MKKIGLLTFPLLDNYGGIVQCVALYGFLKKRGYDVLLLDNTFIYPFWKKIAIYLLIKTPFQNFRGLREKNKNSLLHKGFIKKYFQNMSQELKSKKDFESVCKKYNLDAVIVGSDQVWRFDYINSYYPERYFLDFVPDGEIKKLAYAPSFGNSEWSGDEAITREIKNLLKSFSLITTREKSGEEVCKKYFDVENVNMVLDPTLLVGSEFYEEFFVNKIIKSKNSFVSYILDDTEFKNELLNYVKDFFPNYIYSELKTNKKCTVDDWLWYIKSSDFVVTDSFHGMVFSILFEKQFIVVANQDRGIDRFLSLLNLLDLTNRLIFEGGSYKEIFHEKINYSIVNSKLDELRLFSEQLLLEALG